MKTICPRCQAVQAVRARRFACAGCGQRLRVRRPISKWIHVTAALAIGATGFGLARWTDPAPAEKAPAAVGEEPRVDSGYLRPALPWDAQAADAIRALEHEFDPDHFRFVAARPFVLAIEKSDEVAVPAGEVLACVQELYENFKRVFRVPMGFVEVSAALPVLILATPESYQSYVRGHAEPGRAMDVWGRYEYSRGRIVMLYHPSDWRAMLRHEAVHQLVHALTNPREARGLYWFQEGLAMLFEGGPDGDDPFGVNRARLAGLREAVSGNSPGVPLEELLTLDVDGFWERVNRQENVSRWARDCYAESWGLVYFLYKRHRAALHEYARLELEGRGGRAALEDALRRVDAKDLAELETEWLSFTSSLHW